MDSDSAITLRGIARFIDTLKPSPKRLTATHPAAAGLKVRALGDLIARTLPSLARTDSPTATIGVEPLLSTWYTQCSGRYARVIDAGGRAARTLSVYTDVDGILATPDFIYLTSSGLPSHSIGPWGESIGDERPVLSNRRGYRIPRTPWLAETGVVTPPGDVGVWVNGIPIANLLAHGHHDLVIGQDVFGREDAHPYRHLWLRHAVDTDLDPSNGRLSDDNGYRYHANPLALRSQLRDNVVYLPRTDCYREAGALSSREGTAGARHSPVLGWTFEGLPIYGPYGYVDPLDPSSGVRRMISGFVARDGSHGTIDIGKSGRRCLPRWAASLHGLGERLAPQQVGPDVGAEFKLGRYVEDYDYLGDIGGVQGRDFDLDQCNGRYCVTPDFPDGTFAYFIALRADGSPAFPYVVGPRSYGVRDGGVVREAPREAETMIKAGAHSPIRLDFRDIDSQQLLTWTSIEGGVYRVDGSYDGKNWVNVAVDIQSQGLTTEYTLYATPDNRPYRHFWVTLTA